MDPKKADSRGLNANCLFSLSSLSSECLAFLWVSAAFPFLPQTVEGTGHQSWFSWDHPCSSALDGAGWWVPRRIVDIAKQPMRTASVLGEFHGNHPSLAIPCARDIPVQWKKVPRRSVDSCLWASLWLWVSVVCLWHGCVSPGRLPSHFPSQNSNPPVFQCFVPRSD